MSEENKIVVPMSAEGIKQLRDLLMYRKDVCGPGLASFSPERALSLISAYDAEKSRADKNADDLRKASGLAINANVRAEKAEAQVAHLTAERGWLAERLAAVHPDCPLKYLKQYPLGWKCHEGSQGPCTKSQRTVCWAEAARHVVSKQPVANAATATCPICGGSGHIGDCEED